MAGSSYPLCSFERPFAANSPWNARPVGVVLGRATLPRSDYYPSVASGVWSSAAFRAVDGDPPVTVVGRSPAGVWDPDSEVTRPSVTIPRWPAGVVPAAALDGHCEIVDTVTGIVHSFWQLRQVAGVWQTTQYAWTALAGRGMGDPSHYFQGARAAGLSTLGGLIRKHEVNDGELRYRHALAMSLTFNGLSKNPTYCFPATSADWDAASTNYGGVPMGSLMMLPSSIDAQALATPKLRKVAETLKTFGAYVVDRNYGTPFYIYVENGADFDIHPGGWSNSAAADLDYLRANLRPVESAAGWIDAAGQAFDPRAPMNLLSMRGAWALTRGPQLGVFDTWRQAVVFQSTAEPIEQINAGGRAYAGVTWAAPKAGAPFRLTAIATGGARIRVLLRSGAGAVLRDSGDLADGQTVRFNWPAGDVSVTTIAKSGVGGESSVRAELGATA